MSKHTDYIHEALAVLHKAGIKPDTVKIDGKLYRCPTVRKPNRRNGAYIVHVKPFFVIWYRNWETGEEDTRLPSHNTELTKKERDNLAKVMAETKKLAKKEEAARQAKAAIRAQSRYAKLKKCSKHPYLAFKGVSTVEGLKIDENGLLVFPLKDEHGTIVNLQTINTNGKNKFLMTGARIKGASFCIGKAKRSDTILISESLSTGLSLYESCKLPVYVTCGKDNLLAVATFVRSQFPDARLVVCADNDISKDGSANGGVEKASSAALAVNGLVAIPYTDDNKKCDFNDLHQQNGKAAVRKQVQCVIRPYQMPEFEPLPRGYSFKPNGSRLDLYYENTRLGSAIYVQAHARTSESEGWGKLIGFHDSDNVWHSEYISNSSLMGGAASWIGLLANKGWNGAGSAVRKHLEQYLLEYQVKRRVLLVSSTGWHNNYYVMPDGVIGCGKGERPVLHPVPAENAYGTRGTLKGWKSTIGMWAVGNSRMSLAICAALAGFIIVHYKWAESFGIHFFGDSSKGKSAALQAAASCCGRGSLTGGFIDSWRMTENALEALAAIHSDAPLLLDEMAKASPQVVSESAYTLAGGQGKIRLDAGAALKKVRQWRCIVISSGEKTFADKLSEGNLSPLAGQTVRLLDVPAPAGADGNFFEDIHEHHSSGELANAVKRMAVKHYGHIAPAFIQRLAKKPPEKMEQWLQKYLDKNIAKLCKGNVDGQVSRVASHFLVCAFAGALATHWGLLPWKKGDALKAVKKCFLAWLSVRGGTKSMEEAYLIERVRLFIERYGTSRFESLDGYNGNIRDRVGFKVTVKGQTRYLFLPGSFHKEICKSQNTTQVSKILHRNGMLIRDKDGYATYAPRKLPEIGRVRCYQIIIPDES